MSRRTDIGTYTVAELRQYARELNIPGRSKMTGPELLLACRKGWSDAAAAKEDAVLRTGEVVPGALVTMKCGDVIRAATTVQVEVHQDKGLRTERLYFLGEYVSLCDICKRSTVSLKALNDRAMGRTDFGAPYRHRLFQAVSIEMPADAVTPESWDALKPGDTIGIRRHNEDELVTAWLTITKLENAIHPNNREACRWVVGCVLDPRKPNAWTPEEHFVSLSRIRAVRPMATLLDHSDPTAVVAMLDKAREAITAQTA